MTDTHFINESQIHESLLSQLGDEYTKYSPKLLINNPTTSESILTTILEELTHCQSFMFIVAFVTESGLATLKSHFLDLKRKGIGGRLLTSTYLNFNNPKVFRELLKIENMEVRLTDLQGFHSKGYIFNNYDHKALIIGSANLTAQALKANYEWNVKLTVHPELKLMLQISSQYEEIWNRAHRLTEDWISEYERTYVHFAAKKIVEDQLLAIVDSNRYLEKPAIVITPNAMQQVALRKIEEVRQAGNQKALIISATGTGKTYLSAFDVRNFNPKRMLFIAHREQILLKAKSDFIGLVGGDEQEYGMLSGSDKALQAKYVFATIQTISKPDVLAELNPEAFDYILIDEVHKAGAPSYQRVIDYFKPKFLMGMTATPERTDDFNIYQLFDYNVAYEIRLQEALEEDMLCPFHYYGVTDLEQDGEVIDDTTILAKLVTEERADHVIDKIEYYGYSGQKVKGLIFCSRKEEAIKLSQMMNNRGYETVPLTGDDSVSYREFQVKALENESLQYIITVDIFNEGIDIPCVNQVVMLRQTQSSIIFIQQLGRGLRKHESKEFVTIIDFIGNYKNNYLIPVALSGDKSLNKDNIRRKMKDTSYIKGVSTINFEEIAKEKIYKSISNSNLTELKKLKEAFTELKNRIGRVPYLNDFIKNDSIDPYVIVRTYSNYYQFLLKIKENVPVLTAYEDKVLTMLSNEVLPGKRKHEIILLEKLINQEQVSYEDYISSLNDADCRTDENTLSSVNRVLDLSFFVQAQREKYGGLPICTFREDRDFRFNDEISNSLRNNDYFYDMVLDIIKTAKVKANNYEDTISLSLFQKYTRKDVCKLLNWESDESSTVYGYKVKNQSCPIFITYHKNDDVESSINYGDELITPSILKWYTRSNRTLQSEEVRKIVDAKDNGIIIRVFVKKDDDEGSDFYYLGQAVPDRTTVQQTLMEGKDGKKVPVVHMNMMLERPVENKLYHYIKTGYQSN